MDCDKSLHRSGIVAIVGRPNVGKSTLLNTILGQPVVIVSPTPQTTRHRITCVATRENAQIVFLDTPGIAAVRDPLHRFMQGQAASALEDVDLVLLVLDATIGLRKAERLVIERVRRATPPKVIAVNKTDVAPRSAVDNLLGALGQDPFWETLVPISALRGDHVDTLVTELVGLLPEGPPLYPPDVLIDHSERFVLAEMIREQVFQQTREEVPHATAVLVERVEDHDDDLLYVGASIIVQRDSQKAILIGKGGQRLKEIGAAARTRIEGLLATRVYLDLRVRVRRDWRKRDALLRDYGYEEL